MEEISYKDRIEKFLEDKEDYSLLIRGKWGVGKTYLWKEVWKEILETNNSSTQSFWEKFKKDFYFTAHLKLIVTCLWNFSKASISFLCRYFYYNETSEPEKNIIYISLFGKESYKEVLEEVVLKAYAGNKLLYLFRNLTLWNISVGAFLTLFIKEDFKNTVVCFDDIERKSHNFRMKDFLGLVYQLKENKCKVIVISNTDELPNYEKKFFEKYYVEKSIDLTIEIESKKEVITQILKEKLKDEYYKKLFPKNVYEIENLRYLNKIIRAFKFFSQEFNFENRLKEKEEFKNLFTYVFELIVIKIDTNLKSTANQSEYTINNMIDDYIKNAIISSFTKEQFEKEINNHHFYTLMKELKEKFDNIVTDKNYSNKIKKEIQNIINKMEEKEYISKFVKTMQHEYYYKFCIFDFLSMIEVLNLNNNIIIKIRKEIIKQVPYKNNELIINSACNNNEELRRYAEELAAQSNMNADYNSPQQQKNETSEKIPSDILNYFRFENFIKHNKNLNEELKEAIKDNKIILHYIRHFYDMYYKNNGDKFKEHYPILHEIWSSNKNQY